MSTKRTRSGGANEVAVLRYVVDAKRVALAYAIEGTVALTSLAGAYLFAARYGGGEVAATALMMLAPIAYATLEVARVPLAISARTHASPAMRVLALVAVVCASGVTVKSMAQLGEAAFRPRLEAARDAKAALDLATVEAGDVDARREAADREVDGAAVALRDAQSRAASASALLATPLSDRCVDLVDRRGRRARRCSPDPKAAMMSASIGAASSSASDATRRLDAARAARSALGGDAARAGLYAAKTRYAQAIRDSQVHSFAGMLFGVEPSAVDDGMVAACLRTFVLVPAVLVALASTLLALTSVSATTVPDKAARTSKAVAPRRRRKPAGSADGEPSGPATVPPERPDRGRRTGGGSRGHLRLVK